MGLDLSAGTGPRDQFGHSKADCHEQECNNSPLHIRQKFRQPLARISTRFRWERGIRGSGGGAVLRRRSRLIDRGSHCLVDRGSLPYCGRRSRRDNRWTNRLRLGPGRGLDRTGRRCSPILRLCCCSGSSSRRRSGSRNDVRWIPPGLRTRFRLNRLQLMPGRQHVETDPRFRDARPGSGCRWLSL